MNQSLFILGSQVKCDLCPGIGIVVKVPRQRSRGFIFGGQYAYEVYFPELHGGSVQCLAERDLRRADADEPASSTGVEITMQEAVKILAVQYVLQGHVDSFKEAIVLAAKELETPSERSRDKDC